MKPQIYKIVLVAFFGFLFSVANISVAHALSLDEAKKSGAVGEKLDGYLGAVSAPSAEVSKLVADINAQRRQKYEEISKKNGTPAAAVEKLAATQAIEKTAPGNYVEAAPGKWVKK